ncbi:MAG: hypothetical protein FWH14_00920 [Oscillospiraceae bacterium]|nr:hypothetical protein [Oscillospiraceae bacterium]
MKKLISMLCAIAVLSSGVISAFNFAWATEVSETDGFGVSYEESETEDEVTEEPYVEPTEEGGEVTDQPGAAVGLDVGVYGKTGITVRNPFIYKGQFKEDGGESRTNFSKAFKDHLEIQLIVNNGDYYYEVSAEHIVLTRQTWTPADFYDRPHVQGNADGSIKPQSGNHWFTITTTQFSGITPSGEVVTVPAQSTPFNFAITVTASENAPKVRPVALANDSDNAGAAAHEYTKYTTPNPLGSVWGNSDAATAPSLTRSGNPTAYKIARTSSAGGGWLVVSNEPYHVEISMYKYLYVEVEIEGLENAPDHIRIDNNDSSNPRFNRTSFFDTRAGYNKAGVGCYDLSKISSYTRRFFMNVVCDGMGAADDATLVIVQFWLSNEPLFLGSHDLGLKENGETLAFTGIEGVSLPAKTDYIYGGGPGTDTFEEVSLDGALFNALIDRTFPNRAAEERVQKGFMENIAENIKINPGYKEKDKTTDKDKITVNTQKEIDSKEGAVPTVVTVELTVPGKKDPLTETIEVFYFDKDPKEYRAANDHADTRRVYLRTSSVSVGGVVSKWDGSLEFYGATGNAMFNFEPGHDYLTRGGYLNMDPDNGGYKYLYAEIRAVDSNIPGGSANLRINGHDNRTNYGMQGTTYRIFQHFREDYCVNEFTGLMRFDASGISTNLSAAANPDGVKEIRSINFNNARTSVITGVWVSNDPYLVNPPGAVATRSINELSVIRRPQNEVLYSSGENNNAGMNSNHSIQHIGVDKDENGIYKYGLDYLLGSDTPLSRYRIGIGLSLNGGGMWDIAKDELSQGTLSYGAIDTSTIGSKSVAIAFFKEGVTPKVMETYLDVRVVETFEFDQVAEYGEDTMKLGFIPFDFNGINQRSILRTNGEMMIDGGSGGGNFIWLDPARVEVCPVHPVNANGNDTCARTCPSRPSKFGYSYYTSDQRRTIRAPHRITLSLDTNRRPIYEFSKMSREARVDDGKYDKDKDYTLVNDLNRPLTITWGDPDKKLISAKGFPTTSVYDVLRSQYPPITDANTYYRLGDYVTDDDGAFVLDENGNKKIVGNSYGYVDLPGAKFTDNALVNKPFIDMNDFKYMYLDVDGTSIHHLRLNNVDDFENSIGFGATTGGQRLHGSQINGFFRVSTETFAKSQALFDDNRPGHLWNINLVSMNGDTNLKGIYLSNNPFFNPYSAGPTQDYQVMPSAELLKTKGSSAIEVNIDGSMAFKGADVFTFHPTYERKFSVSQRPYMAVDIKNGAENLTSLNLKLRDTAENSNFMLMNAPAVEKLTGFGNGLTIIDLRSLNSIAIEELHDNLTFELETTGNVEISSIFFSRSAYFKPQFVRNSKKLNTPISTNDLYIQRDNDGKPDPITIPVRGGNDIVVPNTTTIEPGANETTVRAPGLRMEAKTDIFYNMFNDNIEAFYLNIREVQGPVMLQFYSYGAGGSNGPMALITEQYVDETLNNQWLRVDLRDAGEDRLIMQGFIEIRVISAGANSRLRLADTFYAGAGDPLMAGDGSQSYTDYGPAFDADFDSEAYMLSFFSMLAGKVYDTSNRVMKDVMVLLETKQTQGPASFSESLTTEEDGAFEIDHVGLDRQKLKFSNTDEEVIGVMYFRISLDEESGMNGDEMVLNVKDMKNLKVVLGGDEVVMTISPSSGDYNKAMLFVILALIAACAMVLVGLTIWKNKKLSNQE